ncbi:hypothetical protein C5745_18840 [Sphingobacterium haloxyli]|uniref:Peptidase S74 domain-containing protein n=2 Tax=Sphingobacterium haloxyli TaxID=2100533 RepID=A0A2S9IWR1_9SPHI|nr:hypothetical protein C5745_18840 [Sphingobacterium haloxyli]
MLIVELTYAQTTSSVSVDGPGWKRVAYNRLGPAGRGFGKITVFTAGGSNAPRYLDIEWFKDWSVTGGISVKTNSNSGFWTGARVTFDSDTCFIEVNFSKAIPNNLSLLSDNYGWYAAQLYSGPLPNGGGTVRAEARAARFNVENQLTVAYNGNVGVGTATPTSKLAVNGNIRAREIKVETANWPDYVFQKDYELKSLSEVEKYINENGHLPEIPKAEEVEAEGVSLGEMNKLLLKKVEELTLYLLEQDKRIRELEENQSNP